MSARVSRSTPPKAAIRNNSHRRKMVLDVDLNVPPSDNINEVGTSSHVPVAPPVQATQQRPTPPVVPIDVDAFDDDVVLSSPRAFNEAKNNSRRNRNRVNIFDVDSVGGASFSYTTDIHESTSRTATNNRSKRQRVPENQPVINCESYVASQVNGNNVSGNGNEFPGLGRVMYHPPPPPPPPPPPEPTFSCPVCMGPLVDEMTTKCGHIFCKACIKKSISTQGKCPTCRRKVTLKDTIRIYLPATT